MWCRRWLVVLLTVGLGCSATVELRRDVGITPEELLAGRVLRLERPLPPPIDQREVLAISPEMKAFIDANVDRRAGSSLKLQQLVYGMINEGTFGLEYDEITRTAAEVFADRHGNCLSFSILFVAMAKEIGLNVHFQEVDIPPDWSFNQDAYVLNRHVNAVVTIGRDLRQVVDFNIEDFRASYDMEEISDRRALAHFYNNKGVASLQKGKPGAALANLKAALTVGDRRFSPAWTNLGTLYLREGFPTHAEAAYLQALEVHREDLVAMSNLVELYARMGDEEKATLYRNKVESHRKQNPYFRFQLAREAFFGRDFKTAIGHLKYAARKRPQEDQFAFLLGLVYLQIGDEGAARKWMNRAEEIAATDSLKRNYSRKMKFLLSASEKR